MTCDECSRIKASVLALADEATRMRDMLRRSPYGTGPDRREANTHDVWRERLTALVDPQAATRHDAEVAAQAWDEGWRAGRGRGPGHTDACPITAWRSDNPYRDAALRAETKETR